MVTEPCQVSPFPTTFDILCFFVKSVWWKNTYIFHCWKEVPFSPYHSLSMPIIITEKLYISPWCMSWHGKRILQPLRISKVASSERRRQIKGIVHAGWQADGGENGLNQKCCVFWPKTPQIFLCLIHNTTEYIHFITLYSHFLNSSRW